MFLLVYPGALQTLNAAVLEFVLAYAKRSVMKKTPS